MKIAKETQNNNGNIDFNPNEAFSYNDPINEAEITEAIKKLKNNKSPGRDLILNERLKSTSDTLLTVLKNLFNLVFETGIIPEIWTTGIIKPLYKNKGSPTDPSNYRPVTLLSCVGKLFTAVINTRLQNCITDKNIIKDCQAGFRKGFSTIDNIFYVA